MQFSLKNIIYNRFLSQTQGLALPIWEILDSSLIYSINMASTCKIGSGKHPEIRLTLILCTLHSLRKLFECLTRDCYFPALLPSAEFWYDSIVSADDMEGFDGRNRLWESDSRGAQVIYPVFTIGKRNYMWDWKMFWRKKKKCLLHLKNKKRWQKSS